MKVRWRIGERDAVEKFRVEIAGTSSGLQMLLATASVKLMSVNEKNGKDHITSIQQQSQSSLTQQDAVLLLIHNQIEDTNRLLTTGNSVTSKIADALRLNWLRELGAELKGFLRRIISMNIATYHAVLSIQSALPGRLKRVLIEEPFILEDATGRVAPVPLQFATSWDAFNAVLEIRFKNLEGFRKIK
ncbi:uncharacterized protein BDR25DRAFT_372361 [Lindgomyces ingoldianus]|uniref:Uncharacterized protein n=1 Tax=Lindgomyces ingoldianus TaxID=673940 RepID=A0ACB6QQA4_9PLEO|nr:uncharacterized protein BDR25DRAFT_372361 [Lindgomyces ingoldianus]KAF2469173.1 hypothetical protein BDR25DRAFT_372361 [Lindgomyces ingoldianus]